MENTAARQKDATLAAAKTASVREVVRIDAAFQNAGSAKQRTAAYVRVSTSKLEQHESYEAQVNYYTKHIASYEDWVLADIYADEGISGTSTKKREEFHRLMRDCRKGKIDRIIVKSISRFCRNTTDCLAAVRELASHGVSVLFEKEHIDTATQHGELMLTALSDLAQQESMSISGNLRTAVRMRMQNGTYIASAVPFGYRLVKNQLEIHEAEAETVRWIFSQYLAGVGALRIATSLTVGDIPRQDGELGWNKSAVMYILSNERYIGDALWQKTFQSDTLPFRKMYNHGELDRYYVEDLHPAIVSREDFEKVQALLEQRRARYKKHGDPPDYPFTRKVLCGECGTAYRRKLAAGKAFWSCRRHDANATLCPGPRVQEAELEQAFVRLYNKLRLHHSAILGAMLEDLYTLRRTLGLENPAVAEAIGQIAKYTEQNRVLGSLVAKGFMTPELSLAKQNENSREISRLREVKDRLCEMDALDELIRQTRDLTAVLTDSPIHVEAFDAESFAAIVDTITVHSPTGIVFRLHNGLELPEIIQKAVR